MMRPSGVEGFNQEVRGTEGFVMPARQHDAIVWLSGSAYDVFSIWPARIMTCRLAALAEETSSWPYRHDRGSYGFIDGSENPTLLDAPIALCFPKEFPALPAQSFCSKWKHKVGGVGSCAGRSAGAHMGRTKPDSIDSRTNQRIPM